jgi:hypothetical protein
VLAALAWWRGRPVGLGVFATPGALLVVSAVAVPTRLGPVFRAWMGLAHRLSRITTPFFLGLVYFLSVTPIGLALRVFRRRARRDAPPSFWVSRAADSRQRGGMEHQF